MNKLNAAFFDLDGTIIKDVGYLSDIKQVEIIQDSLNLILYLQSNNYKIFVITNQSGVARGYFDLEFINKKHEYINNLLLKQNIIITKYYTCPHYNEPDKVINKKYLKNCDCRKPKPGLILQAASSFNIDLTKSLMFGDKILDIKAGEAAGCKSFYIQKFFNIPKKDKLKFYENIFKDILK
ncbi:MAG: D,D-heptose 1,7-bisphosphate phosphatase [candidate division TM6 bacterium GW2011_GWF2_28_16]|jgi:D-glycero-D-manno-heptose 1,7-bisphosphate phosphatase|nr:MAG: D,D-heptose 1,7-bisphosphate phosphatase [candidate division TM6 bacterium GW2011_GWF2_28_16]